MDTFLAPGEGALSAATGSLRAAVDALLAADLDPVSGPRLIEAVEAVEVQVRRLAAVDARLLTAVDACGLTGEFGATSTRDLLRDRLRIPAARAAARLAAAGDIGPRRTLAGEPLPPLRPLLAAAQAQGLVDADAARRIRAFLDSLPGDLEARRGPGAEADVEATLVTAATHLDAQQLGAVIERLRAYLDPDGKEPREERIRQRRGLDLTTRPDGTSSLRGELTREAAAALAAVLDPLSAPAPAEDGTRDPRSPTQRRHDALLDACHRLLRGDLPDSGGVPATILLTIDADDLPEPDENPHRDPDTGSGADGSAANPSTPTASDDPDPDTGPADDGSDRKRPRRTGPGWARTPAGGLIPLPVALRLADQAEIYTLVRNHAGGILAAELTRRLATPAQRRALAARDLGCSFPGCTRPPSWCQAAHIVAWADGGPTTLENLTLVCGFHHREYDRMGWTCRMHPTDLVPEWIPPPELDPDQIPRRNTAHQILRL